jgi:hypothetical protein
MRSALYFLNMSSSRASSRPSRTAILLLVLTLALLALEVWGIRTSLASLF